MQKEYKWRRGVCCPAGSNRPGAGAFWLHDLWGDSSEGGLSAQTQLLTSSAVQHSGEQTCAGSHGSIKASVRRAARPPTAVWVRSFDQHSRKRWTFWEDYRHYLTWSKSTIFSTISFIIWTDYFVFLSVRIFKFGALTLSNLMQKHVQTLFPLFCPTLLAAGLPHEGRQIKWSCCWSEGSELREGYVNMGGTSASFRGDDPLTSSSELRRHWVNTGRTDMNPPTQGSELDQIRVKLVQTASIWGSGEEHQPTWIHHGASH